MTDIAKITQVLTDIARQIADLERRGDYSALRTQTINNWMDWGGYVGERRGRKAYRLPSGKTCADRDQAIREWAAN